MKVFIILLLTVSFNLWADTVRLTSPTDFTVEAVTNSTYSLFVDEPSGDATADTAPARIYIPVANTANGNDNYYYQSRSGAVLNTFNVETAAHVVRIPLTVAATQTQYVYLAAKPSTGSTGYKIIQRFGSSIGSNTDINFDLSPKLICDQFPTECSLLKVTSNSMTEVTFKTYFFLSTDGTLTLGAAGEPATYTGGIYIELPMSNRIYTSSSLVVSISGTRKGDSRVFLDYTSSATMLNFKKVLVYQHTASTPPATPPGIFNQPVASYPTGTFLDKDFSTVQTGELTINELTNGLEYIFSVAFVDKYGFATTLSDDASGIPTQIEELLKKQACFILTAGFGEEHFITDYFRSYRDHVLAHSWLGRQMIKVYYRTAPQYALFIYQHESLRSAIRAIAYILYFQFKYGLLVLIFLLSCHFLNILRKNKIFLMNNRL